jgi:hypothetical protein
MPPLNLGDAENLRQLVVDPLVAALRAEMREALRPLIDDISALRHQESVQVARLDRIDQRLTAIEKFKARIAAVSGAIALVAGFAWSAAADYLKSRISKIL